MKTLITFLLLLLCLNSFSQDASKLFKANCSGCHKTTNQRVVGPGLLGVKSRWPDSTKLNSWIKNSTSFLKTGDPYATKLYEEYGKSVMPAQGLSDAEITSIVDWVDKGGDVVSDTTASAGVATGTQEGVGKSDNNFERIIMFILVTILLIIIVILRGVIVGVIKYSIDNPKVKIKNKIDIADITNTIVEKMIEDKIIKNSKEESITLAINEILSSKLNNK